MTIIAIDAKFNMIVDVSVKGITGREAKPTVILTRRLTSTIISQIYDS